MGNNVVVIDDTKICLERTVEVLRKEGWQNVAPVHAVEDISDQFNLPLEDPKAPMPEICANKIASADLVVTEFCLGGIFTAWGFILAMRRQFPDLPIVLLTRARMQLLCLKFNGIFFVEKGRQFNASIFPKAGKRTLFERNPVKEGFVCFNYRADALPLITEDDPAWQSDTKISVEDARVHQYLSIPPLWSDLKVENPFEILMREVIEWKPPLRPDLRSYQLEELREIAKLKDPKKSQIMCGVGSAEKWFGIKKPETITQAVGHCMCDGDLLPEDVEPFLADIRDVLERIKDHVKQDSRFRVCAEFILSGQPVENLPLILGCY